MQYWRYAIACGRAKPMAMKEPARMMVRRWVRLLALGALKKARRQAMASKRKIVPWRRPLLRKRVERAKLRPERRIQADLAREDC
jgi:hypothetical protein